MKFFPLLSILILYLVSIPSQTLQSSISKTTLEAKRINPIEDLNTDLQSQDRFYVSNISQNTSQVASASGISATPNITEILSTIDEDMFLISISPDEQIAIFAVDYSCFSIYNISNLKQPTVLSQLCFEHGLMSTNLGVISSDSKTGFLVNSYQDALLVIDLSNPTYPSIINSFSFTTPPSQSYPVKTSSMVLSSDGQTLFIQSQVLPPIITIIDVSNPGSLRNISTYALPFESNYGDINKLCIRNNMLFSMSNSVYVIDISDLENPTTLAAIDAGSIPLNLAVSSNGQYLFVVSSDTEGYQYQTYFEVFDLSNISSITRQSAVFIGYWSGIGGISMNISPDNTRIYIVGFGEILFIDVSNISNPLLYNMDPQSYVGYDSSLTLLPDGRSAILSYIDETTIIQVQFDVPISLAENITATANIPVLNTMSLSGDYSDDSNVSMAISSDSKTIFIQFPGNLDIINVSNVTSPNVLSTFNNTSLDNYCGAVTISPDDQTAFLVCASSIITLNISDLSSPTILGTFPVNLQEYQLTLSSDGQTGFLLTSTGMQILNLTNVRSPTTLSTYHLGSVRTPNIIRMSQDPNIVYLYAFAEDQSASSEDYLEIVDISNLASPVQIYSTRFETYSYPNSFGLDYPVPLLMPISPGNQVTILVFNTNSSAFRTLQTDTSLGSTTLPAQITTSELINLSPMTIMSALYSPTIYLLTDNEQVIVIDISTIASPMILRSFNAGSADSLALSPDDSTLFLATSNGTLSIMDLTPQYSLYLQKNNFVLGEVFSNDLVPLALSSTNEFVTMEQDFVFTQVSLYNVTSGISSPVAYVALPHWISIDLDQLTVTFAPDDPSQIGSYQLYGVASTQIPNDTFIGIGTITNATESFDLFVTLISLGYLNSQGFLTSSFSPKNNFFLTSQYSQYQTEVYNKLMEYYIEVITTFTVASSLYLEQVVTTFVNSSMETTISKTMTLNTLNTDSVNVIFMLSTNQSQFVSSASIVVTIISNNHTTLSLQGSLVDINNAITQIIINLDENITSCNGNMTISDGLNPPLYQDIPNISDYFTKNQVPSLNPNFSIESLLYHTPVQTGAQFILDLTNMFIDSNGQDLQYTLTMQNNSQPLPDWLSFKGETIVGTPPKQFLQSEYNLVITASNQFKSLSQPFTINISYSLSYILELIGTYGGALLTLIGFYVYVHKIYNVLCKRRYRYQKDFLIRAGDKKSVKQICAISFISDEIQASKLILAEIKKNVAQEKNLSTVSMAELVQYFMEANSRQIEEDRVTQMIKSGMSIISSTHKGNDASERTELEHVKGYLRIKVIKQLIINQLVNTQLNLKQERSTKQLFNRIKDDWMNLVETSRDHGFTLNKDKLVKKLESMKITLYKPQKSEKISMADAPLNNSPLLTSDSADRKNIINILDSGTLDSNLSPAVEGKKSVQKDLIDPIEVETVEENAGINFILLEKSIIAHAFEYHNLDVKPIEIEVCSHEKLFGGTSCISKINAFLKWDLFYVRFAKGCEIGYGIKYKISNGILRFYGTPQEEIKDKTLAVQIVSRRGFIKKELWLNCVGKIAEDEKPLRVL